MSVDNHMSELNNQPLSEREFKNLYGEFYAQGAEVEIDQANVPENLKSLIPYARFWGIEDDVDRKRLLEAAPPEIVADLARAVGPLVDDIDRWVQSKGGTGSTPSYPSDELIAFIDLRRLFDNPRLQ
jgi:hypothetical protein